MKSVKIQLMVSKHYLKQSMKLITFIPLNKKKENPLRYALSHIFDAEKKDKDYPIRSYDDTGNADRFIDRYGHLYKHSYITNKFYIYDGQNGKLMTEVLLGNSLMK